MNIINLTHFRIDYRIDYRIDNKIDYRIDYRIEIDYCMKVLINNLQLYCLNVTYKPRKKLAHHTCYN